MTVCTAPSPQVIFQLVGTSDEESTVLSTEDRVRVYVAPSLTEAAPEMVTVGGTFLTVIGRLFEANVPSPSAMVAVALMV